MRRPPFRALAALAAAAVVAVPLAGCGSEELDPETVAHAAAATADAGAMSFRYTADAEGLEMRGDGYLQTRPLRMRMTVAMDLGEMEVRADEERMYLRLPEGMGGAFGARGGGWVSASVEQLGGPNLGSLASGRLGTSDPSQQLQMLRAIGDIEEVGSEEVDGVPTTHYRGELDLREAVRFAAPSQRTALERSIDALEAQDPDAAVVPTEVWVDEQDLVRRVEQVIPGTPEVTMTMDLFDFGQRRDVPIPAKAVDLTQDLSAAP